MLMNIRYKEFEKFMFMKFALEECDFKFINFNYYFHFICMQRFVSI